ncbi:MAG: hypothetical protein D6790_00145 [Caldilineae bacterium]|nr:MAG: hypothetical protein D6790_00145 [Caldilineae bacterium]
MQPAGRAVAVGVGVKVTLVGVGVREGVGVSVPGVAVGVGVGRTENVVGVGVAVGATSQANRETSSTIKAVRPPLPSLRTPNSTRMERPRSQVRSYCRKTQSLLLANWSIRRLMRAPVLAS